MKRTGMTVALLIAVASVSASAQAGGNTPDRRPASSAQGTVGPKQSSAGTGKIKLQKGNGTTSFESGAGSGGSQSTGTPSGQHRKAQTVNQQAAGVRPTTGSASTSSSSKPNRNQ